MKGFRHNYRLLGGKLQKALLGLGALAFLNACNDPETFFASQTDRFTNHFSDNYNQASALLQADYLFVVDYSYSMSSGANSKIEALVSSLDLFTSELRSNDIDYRIGIVNGNTHARSSAQIATNFVAPLLTIETLNSLESDIISQTRNIGAPLNQNTNYLLEAGLRTLTAQRASLLREEAQLVVVYISDGDDESQLNSTISGAKTPAYYAGEMRKFKTHPSYVSARSLTAGVAANCSIPSSNNYFEFAGTRIATTATQLDALNAPANCIYNTFDSSLTDLARNVTRPTGRFKIRGTPVPSSIEVIENNLTVDPARYTYNGATNEIIFLAGQEPALSAELSIVYDMLFPLTGTPRVDTLAVTLNGISISRSETNGFVYIASENRIEFRGASKPAEGDDVRVSYQRQ